MLLDKILLKYSSEYSSEVCIALSYLPDLMDLADG